MYYIFRRMRFQFFVERFKLSHLTASFCGTRPHMISNYFLLVFRCDSVSVLCLFCHNVFMKVTVCSE